MNWNSILFDWNQVRAFLATAEEGSFSAAARVLNTTQPTISRQITALEAKLKAALFERNVTGQTITVAGQELLDHVRVMGEAAALISMVADRQSQEVAGNVVLTATDLMSAAILPKILRSLRETAPGITIRIVETNDNQNLMKREADIAIRHMHPKEPDLTARHVGDLRGNLYAARDYFNRKGRPRNLREVADHDFIGIPEPAHLIKALQNMGVPIHAKNFVIQPQSSMVTWEMVKAGHGIAMLPEFLGENEPDIEGAHPNLPSLEFPIWLVTHRELQTSLRIRTVFDTLAVQLRAIAGSRH